MVPTEGGRTTVREGEYRVEDWQKIGKGREEDW